MDDRTGASRGPILLLGCLTGALLGVAVGLALQPLGLAATLLGGGLVAGGLVSWLIHLDSERGPEELDEPEDAPRFVTTWLRQLARAVEGQIGADPLDPDSGAAGTGFRTDAFTLHGVATSDGVVAVLTFPDTPLRVTFDGSTGITTVSEPVVYDDWCVRMRRCLASLPPQPVAAPAGDESVTPEPATAAPAVPERAADEASEVAEPTRPVVPGQRTAKRTPARGPLELTG